MSRDPYSALQNRVLKLGWVRPGSLVRRLVRCGKSTCRCMADPSEPHGPYWQWTHKVRGKTITRRLTSEQAKLCEKWLADHRRLKAVVRRMEALSLKETDRLLDALRE